MLIGDKYKVEADRNNLILMCKKATKDDVEAIDDGEEVEQGWRNLGYFYNFRELLKFMADNDIKGEGLDDLTKVAEKQETLYDLILTVRNITPDIIHVKTKKQAPSVVQ